MNRRFRNNGKKKFGFIFLAIIALIFLLVWLVQWLWNLLLPEIIGVKSITYWQAFGILVLSKILFGGFKFNKHNRKFDFRNPSFRENMRERMSNLSDEDKERFREEWKKRFDDKCRFR